MFNENDADIGEERGEALHEVVLAIDEQGGQAGIVVVPTPTLTEQERVLEGLVGHDATANRVDADGANLIDEIVHIAVVEGRVHTADANEVADERAPDDFALVAQFGRELMVAAEEVERGNRREQFHRRGRAHPLAVVVGVEDGVGGQVPDHQAELGGFEEPRFFDERV